MCVNACGCMSVRKYETVRCAEHRRGIGAGAPVGFRDVIEDETANLPFDIAWLIAHWNLYKDAQDWTSATRIQKGV
jgi:hypothetical protein